MELTKLTGEELSSLFETYYDFIHKLSKLNNQDERLRKLLFKLYDELKHEYTVREKEKLKTIKK
jgi:hypothetical protein